MLTAKLLSNDSLALSGDNYTVYNSDCIEILEQLPEKSVKLIFADPPYNLQLQKELYRPNQTKVAGVNDSWDKFASFAEYDNFTEKWLKLCLRLLTDDGTIWVIGSYHNIYRVGKIMLDLGYWILNDVQWHKTNPMPNFRGVRFTNATETLLWAKKSQTQKKYTFNHFAMKQLNDGKQMNSVWQIPLCTGKERIKGADGKKAHSTQKPEELLKRVILSSSNEGDLILDPFLGSGTSCAVAKKLARKSIGIEQNSDYLPMIQKRLDAINPDDFADLRIKEPVKNSKKKVSIQQLISSNYLKENQIIYSNNKKHSAIILKDGTIKSTIGIGSIHKIGAILKNTDSCNGWLFWYFEDFANLKLLDEKRIIYRKNNGLL